MTYELLARPRALIRSVAAIQKFSADVVIFEAALIIESSRRCFRSSPSESSLPFGCRTAEEPDQENDA